MKITEIQNKLAEIQSRCNGKDPFGVQSDLKILYDSIPSEEKKMLIEHLKNTSGNLLYAKNVTAFLDLLKYSKEDLSMKNFSSLHCTIDSTILEKEILNYMVHLMKRKIGGKQYQ